MKNILRYEFMAILVFTLFGCNFMSDKTLISNKKNFEFINGDYISKIIIFDKNKKQYEKNIEPESYHGWTEEFIGNFEFIYIQTENDIEAIFIVNNNFNKKLLFFDIISKEELARKIIDGIFDPYRITIEIIDNKFEIKYDIKKYNVLCYFNYNENYLINKEKYMNEYNYRE
jgi:hypothetical protein